MRVPILMLLMRLQILVVFLGVLDCCRSAIQAKESSLEGLQAKLKVAGDEMLETLDVSYVYGGGKIADAGTCNLCNQCLEMHRPIPKERLNTCPTCASCSLDCSHFTQMVYSRAGIGYPYLTTKQMIEMSAPDLERKFGLVSISTSAAHVIAGDLLVYNGHVAIVEKRHDRATADVIHATGGRDLKGPGQGIQRERFVKVETFRGSLRRVLRHKRTESLRLSGIRTTAAKDGQPDLSRLRKIEKNP